MADTAYLPVRQVSDSIDLLVLLLLFFISRNKFLYKYTFCIRSSLGCT